MRPHRGRLPGGNWIPPNAHELWVAHDLQCAMLWVHSLNGYVQLHEGHPWLGMGYSEVQGHCRIYGDLDSPLTYGVDRYGWLGFDTSHAMDVWDPDVARELIAQIKDDDARRGAQRYRELLGDFGDPPVPSQWIRRWDVEKVRHATEWLALVCREAGRR
jgi:hypothetical protein